MKIPTGPQEINDERIRIQGEIRTVKLQIAFLNGQLKALQAACPHPDMRTWKTNPQGRWPTDHEKCHNCGLERKT